MSKVRIKDKKLGLIITLVIILVVPVALGIITCYKSYKLKEYKKNLLYLDPTWTCTVTYNGNTVVLSDDNQTSLINLFTRDSQKLTTSKPNILDTIHLVFTKDGKKRTLDISRTDNDLLKIDLHSVKEFHIYIREKTHFEKLQKLISPEGLNGPNKKVNTKK